MENKILNKLVEPRLSDRYIKYRVYVRHGSLPNEDVW